ncbi:MAG: electron transfer flavoprotein subunit alpha/FixB family protein [Bacteroidales bacterium]|jgi:electron transfer flavoprotein alpha subunit|nr:electron transfer flavoprotein subunit alpha/FixB family protein [Bacteroidales bacterium]
MSILVYTENWEGKFKKLSFELVSYASALAEMMNTSVTALSIGNAGIEELKKLGIYGASKILNIADEGVRVFDNQAYTELIADAAQKEGATVVILSNNISGKALAPRLSVRLKAGLGSGVSRLPLSLDPFTVYKRAYSGNAYAHLIINTGIRILTLAQNSFEMREKPTGAEPVIVRNAVTTTPVTEVTDRSVQAGKILLTDAGIVVSGGRGMKSPENWKPLEELASLLGGATACSRPVSDEGWRPHEEHTGQTGKIIAPDLYLAVGISGATQHLAGVSSSKYIVAINNDKDAPIFESAQYGIVGDAMKVLPKLVEAVKAIKK